MTRFARAKGSKASNERAPEDATPWEVMKSQLLRAKQDSEEATKRHEAEQQRIENYENFLKEHKSQKRKATWCDFPETNIEWLKPNVNQFSDNVEPSPKMKKNKKKKNVKDTSTEESVFNDSQRDSNEKKKVDAEETEPDIIPETEEVKPSKKNKKKKKSSQGDDENNSEMLSKTETDQSVAETDVPKLQIEASEAVQGQAPKKKKNKKNKNLNPVDELNEKPSNQNIGDNDKRTSNFNRNPDLRELANSNRQNNDFQKKRNKNTEAVRRKPIDDTTFQFIINGKEVELARFDGFPIMKRDAERLQDLKNNMIKKGIPKSEVQRTLKLERRRAEKALARMKRDVCYNCRKGGHNLSDCPDLKAKIPGGMNGADGVCFKCGSTEHRQFECKVQRDKEFRFATCFICKDQGHIARQCPDNPKGLYPNGGGCKLCGDVTHLRKDCPTVQDKREESNLKLQTLDAVDNLEDIGQLPPKTAPPVDSGPKKPKKIKF